MKPRQLERGILLRKGPSKMFTLFIELSSGKVFLCSMLVLWQISIEEKKHLLRKCWTNLRMFKGKFKESCENKVKSQIPEENGELECACADIPLHCWSVQGKLSRPNALYPRFPTTLYACIESLLCRTMIFSINCYSIIKAVN